jgi:hypothetical protein
VIENQSNSVEESTFLRFAREPALHDTFSLNKMNRSFATLEDKLSSASDEYGVEGMLTPHIIEELLANADRKCETTELFNFD